MIRIVKMEFHDRNIDDFKLIFEEIKMKITGSKGCIRLQLLQDQNNPAVFFTYSEWESEADLELYRHSELFDNTWSIIKKWFNAKPLAWTLNSISG